MSSVEKIDGIISKIHLILERNLKLEESVKDLKQKLTDSEKKRKSLEKENDGFRKDVQLMKMAKSVEITDDERANIKRELKRYIKEIDKCMALLNR